jgi:hypothetical protein
MRRSSEWSPLALGVLLTLALVLATSTPSAAASGGGYDLTWFKVAGGGVSTSSGGTFTLGGTIGQPDAGVLTGGDYSLAGGFWHGTNALQLVDVPPAPVAPRAVLSLRGLTRNPAALSDLAVAFSLASDSPAELEMLDVAGRRVAATEVGALGAGPHVLALNPAHPPAPGLYWLRLTQSGVSRVAKAVLLK